jgi:hypothetical protein
MKCWHTEACSRAIRLVTRQRPRRLALSARVSSNSCAMRCTCTRAVASRLVVRPSSCDERVSICYCVSAVVPCQADGTFERCRDVLTNNGIEIATLAEPSCHATEVHGYTCNVPVRAYTGISPSPSSTCLSGRYRKDRSRLLATIADMPIYPRRGTKDSVGLSQQPSHFSDL